MHQKQSRSEGHGKDEVNGERPLTKAGAKKAMARFESLARKLLIVSRDQLKEEERKHKLARRNRGQT